MLSNFVTFGPLLVGLTALVALVLSNTRSATLRRREETLREIKASLDPRERHTTAIVRLHRATVAAVVARQTHGAWPFVWPWLMWIITAALFGQSGFYLGKYVESGQPFELNTFAYEVFGGDVPAFLVVIAGWLFISQAFRNYEHSLYQRARTARAFYNRGEISHCQRIFGFHDFYRERRPGPSWRWFVRDLVPGTAALSVGLAGGVAVYVRAESQQTDGVTPLLMTAFWTGVPALTSVIAASFVAIGVHERRSDIELLPRPRVSSRLGLRRALVSTDNGSIAGRAHSNRSRSSWRINVRRSRAVGQKVTTTEPDS
ncbi:MULTISPECIES: hypothetical protein [unclassified Rhodococcus (in: high G+C Gram-positive bacteria)]|uniref:hypothetical protein n=1 Tax=unclassified Rhodococcus (in: high G+C Gram-positive bacteria) TaxID=192944 RepID=UPI00113FCCBD|nr:MULTISPECIES: hypothetical protein [unclassified Rhodococcus (in: high G+C Gram-positive bacteria)]